MKIRFSRAAPGAFSMALLTSTLLGVTLITDTPQRSPDAAHANDRATTASSASPVYFVGALADEDLIALSTAVVAGDRPGVLLLDSPKLNSQWKNFLNGQRPEGVVPVGSFPKVIADLERRLGSPTAPV